MMKTLTIHCTERLKLLDKLIFRSLLRVCETKNCNPFSFAGGECCPSTGRTRKEVKKICVKLLNFVLMVFV